MTTNERVAEQAWWDKPRDADAASNLDQAELTTIRDGSGAIEDGVSDERCSNELFDEGSDFEDESRVVATDLQADELVGGAIDQAKLRLRDLGDRYPFSLDGSRLSHTASDNHWAYTFCLLASLANEFDSQQKRRLRACFEVLTRDVSKVYWGSTANSFRCGHPWDIYAAKHFRKTKAVFEYLHGLVGDKYDWKWGPLEELPEDPSYQRSKDLGVDVVTWRPWQDDRGGQHYLLVQCATTERGVLSKADDIKRTRLEEYMRMPCAGFAKAIATPSCILNPTAIRELSRRAGLVFERSRIVKVVHSAEWGSEQRESQEKCIELTQQIMPGLTA